MDKIEVKKEKIWVIGFEPTASCTPCKRASQAALHPDKKIKYRKDLQTEIQLYEIH